jgi:hypothetical protein
MNDIIYISDEDAIFLDLDTQRKLPIKGAFSIEGLYCYLNDDGEYKPDFSVTVFYRDGETDSDNYICFEQDSPEIAYHNMKHEIIEAVMDHNDRVA